jgi:arsenite methyltransferase
MKKLKALVCMMAFCCPLWIGAQDARDRYHQPNKVMDVMGVEPGMRIGEVGAGGGYFTFHLSRRVGETGKVYANDISRRALNSLERRCRRESVTNIETVLGEVEDPLLPQNLDMVFIVNAFHDIRRQVPLLNNLASSLKPGAPVVIIDRDPGKMNNFSGHVLTQQELLAKIEESVFELDRIETFLPQHNIYIIRHVVQNRVVTHPTPWKVMNDLEQKMEQDDDNKIYCD